MAFQKGESGNPQGKPKGTRHRVTIAAEILLEGEAEAITRKAIELAKAGTARPYGSAWIASFRRGRTGRLGSGCRPSKRLGTRSPRMLPWWVPSQLETSHLRRP